MEASGEIIHSFRTIPPTEKLRAPHFVGNSPLSRDTPIVAIGQKNVLSLEPFSHLKDYDLWSPFYLKDLTLKWLNVKDLHDPTREDPA